MITGGVRDVREMAEIGFPAFSATVSISGNGMVGIRKFDRLGKL